LLSSVQNVFRIPDLRGKILFTLLMIALYRVGAFIPAPGIDLDAVEELKRQAETGGGVVGFLQLFSGRRAAVHHACHGGHPQKVHRALGGVHQ
jgi:preprotein translocase subunit SecY